MGKIGYFRVVLEVKELVGVLFLKREIVSE